jgi:hypothetical protein
MSANVEAKQRAFRSSLRNSRRKTFPKFSSRQTKFQDADKRPKLMRRTSLPVAKTGSSLFKGRERKGSLASLTNLFCLPVQTNMKDFRDSGVYDVTEDTSSSEDSMQEIKLTLKRGSVPGLGSKT